MPSGEHLSDLHWFARVVAEFLSKQRAYAKGGTDWVCVVVGVEVVISGGGGGGYCFLLTPPQPSPFIPLTATHCSLGDGSPFNARSESTGGSFEIELPTE